MTFILYYNTDSFNPLLSELHSKPMCCKCLCVVVIFLNITEEIISLLEGLLFVINTFLCFCYCMFILQHVASYM